MITENEVNFGLVLHLDPDELEANEATYTCAAEARVTGAHFFLCIGADDDCGRWLPLYSNAGIGRRELGPAGRSGHPKWTQGKFHYHVGQLWTATHYAGSRAARAGGDLSTPENRNRMTNECADAVAASIAAYVD